MQELKVEGMTCGGCANSVKKAIQAVDQKAEVQVNLESKIVKIESDLSKLKLTELIENAGFEVV